MGDIRLANADWQEDSQAGAVSGIDGLPLNGGLSREQFESWHDEIKNQPSWRTEADREADYYDGNQLDADVLRKQAAIGIPPAIEPLIGPVIDAVLGMEAQRRTDWRVTPDGPPGGEEVAEAINFKLNQAERESHADRACSDGFAGQSKVGIGIVEVSRETDPFKYRYRVNPVRRNEVWWDWHSIEPDMSDARYMVRRKWMHKDQVKLKFPEYAQLIEQAAGGWTSFDTTLSRDGGHSTGLSMGGMPPLTAYGAITTPLAGQSAAAYPMLAAYQQQERGSTLEEMEWRDVANNRVCLFECWYRVWSQVLVMELPDGRVVEYNPEDLMHLMLVQSGAILPEWRVVSKVRLAWWMGPHKLSDDASPYRHNKFPYVFFWGKREDRTGVPYGLIRGMMYLQDNINASTSKIRWGLSAIRTMRTQGATVADDATIRTEVARPDADIVLAKDFTTKGHVFKVERDFQLTEQQYKMLADSREGIKRVGGVQNAFMGQGTNSQSGVAVANLAEQSVQSLADLYDNFQTGRMAVGDLLVSLIVEDMAERQETVVIKGNALKQDKVIKLNVPRIDPETGIQYLDNDIQRTKLKVALEEVPSTPSFRSQQLMSMSEVFKSIPPQFQQVLLPQLLALMDVPNKDEVLRQVQEAMQQLSPEEIEKRIADEVDKALLKANVEFKTRELGLKQELNNATIKNLTATAVKTGTEAAYAAIQTGQAIATMPAIAPIADVVMQNAGYTAPQPSGIDPNLPIVPAAAVPPPVVRENTSPQLPPVPASPMTGVETLRNDGARP